MPMHLTRSTTRARNGIVATPHYLASQAGLRVLQAGGNAVDAAIAANAVLNVTCPHLCSTGGDLFIMLYDKKTDSLNAFNGSGRAPAAATPEWFATNGYSEMPKRGMLAVTVPGVVDGWQQVSDRFGRLGLARSLAPAIEYAADGFPISAHLHNAIRLVSAQEWCHPMWQATFAADGVPQPGAILRQPQLAATLQAIADGGRDVFYNGDIARAIVQFSEQEGGLFTLDDFREHSGEWVTPLHVGYRDYTIYEMPPNTHGLTALQMLALVDKFDVGDDPHDPAILHLMVEAKKLAFADRAAYITDPTHMKADPAVLLSETYLDARRALIDPLRAAPSVEAGGMSGDTIYLCAADREGNAVSLIQSNYMGVGAGVVVPGTGLELQNRGAYFSLDPAHANVIAPRKRTMHTLIPSMAFRGDRPAIVFGTMGGDGQPQTHLQVYANLINFGMEMQEAIDAPRWVHGRPDQARVNDPVTETAAERLDIESRFPQRSFDGLRERGHAVEDVGAWSSALGHAHGIVIDPDTGVLSGGADPRADSAAAGW